MKNKIIKITVKICIIIILIVGFFLVNELIDDNKKKSFVYINGNIGYSYQLEEASTEEDDLVIKGWFFKQKKYRNIEQDFNYEDQLGLLLFDIDKNTGTSSGELKGVVTQLIREKRDDINEYFSCEYDYSDCGFVCKINKSLVDLDNGKYEIIIKPDINSNRGLVVGYLINGKLEYINPKEHVLLDVKNSDLEKIVNEGTCLVCDSNFHICVYQYDWKLYWIADSFFDFENDESTFIQYRVDTTQFNKLPSDRREKELFWDDLGADFESGEITSEINCGIYRVYVRDLPKDYSVTEIETGYYSDGKWIWQRSFKPDYRFLLKK